MPYVPIRDVCVQPKTDWIVSNFTYFSLKLIIIVIADVMICNCWMFGGRETAGLSPRQIEAETIKRNWKVCLLVLRGKEMTTRVLRFEQSPPAEMVQSPRELMVAVLVTLGDRVSTLITGKVQSFLCQWKSSLSKKTYKDTFTQYQVRHRKIRTLLIWTHQGRCTSHSCPYW